MIPQLPGGGITGRGEGCQRRLGGAENSYYFKRAGGGSAGGGEGAGVSTGGRKGADRSRLDLLRR